MLQNAGGLPVHKPANPDVFQFDEEVSRIFPDMAKRAIPMYHEAHRAHIGMLAQFLSQSRRAVLDIGASRGAFFDHLKEGVGADVYYNQLTLNAVEHSGPMLEYLIENYPEVRSCLDDLSSGTDGGQHWRLQTYDVVVLYYVLQFIRPEAQVNALRRALRAVGSGGYFIFGHKAALSGTLGAWAQEEYIRFRTRNGYSPEEIAAKTRALKGAMFQLSDETVRELVRAEGFEIQDTVRWMAFSSFIARRV